MAKDTTGLDDHQRDFVRLVEATAGNRRRYEVFADFCEMSALAISNSVDILQKEKREERYLQIVKKYDADQVANFPRMLGCIVLSLERGMADCLGAIFMHMELGNAHAGQFFTPFHLSHLMAGLVMGDARAEIERKGFLRINEPAAGAGGMVIAVAQALLDQGINYQHCMHAVAQDIDALACQMAYITLSLCHVPAIVVHGNTLSLEEWGHWVTPAHVLGRWDRRLKRTQAEQACVPLLVDVEQPQTPAATHEVEAAAAAVVDKRLEQLSLFG